MEPLTPPPVPADGPMSLPSTSGRSGPSLRDVGRGMSPTAMTQARPMAPGSTPPTGPGRSSSPGDVVPADQDSSTAPDARLQNNVDGASQSRGEVFMGILGMLARGVMALATKFRHTFLVVALLILLPKYGKYLCKVST